MATQKKKKTTSAPRSRNAGMTPASPGLMAKLQKLRTVNISEYVRRDSITFVIGFLLFLVSTVMLVSVFSNFFTGREDQSGVESHNLSHAANICGTVGAYLSHALMDGGFGVFAFFIPLFLILLSMKLMNAYKVRLWKWFLNFSILMIWGSLFFSLLEDILEDILPDAFLRLFSFRLGGAHGDYVKDLLSNSIGKLGAWLVMLATAILYLIYLTGETINVVRKMLHPQDFIRTHLPSGESAEEDGPAEDGGFEEADAPAERETFASLPTSEGEEENSTDDEESDLNDEDEAPLSIELSAGLSEGRELRDSDAPAEFKIEEPTATELDIQQTVTNESADGRTVEEVTEMEPYDPRKDLEFYKFPVTSLLKHYDNDGPSIDMDEQNANKDRIIEVLRSFGVEITSIKATIGPTITLYEVTLAPGVRINKIRQLEDDIALSLKAVGIRIIAPMPGKGTVGIEVPNEKPNIVSMESLINTRKFQETDYNLPIALGKTITNEVFMVDLAKCPHLLVAGATGQGKSVGLNAIITSLLYKKHPNELKFVLVDPKKVEFSIYAPIADHFMASLPENDEEPIITDVNKVVRTLKSLCTLMDHRYDMLKLAGARNIKEYNDKFVNHKLDLTKGHEYMPYIVVVIDEFGDLIMTAGKDIETPIARIAQLARAVGIHMIIATQRPTTSIITGNIKANFPGRMAFKVSARIDSGTILDRIGADQLIGRGDMLILNGKEPDPVRVQCAFVDTPEVEQIADYISHQSGPVEPMELPEPETDDAAGGDMGFSGGNGDMGDLDPLFKEAASFVVATQQGSTSKLQRKYQIGYNRAGRLMDQLEKAGVVGAAFGSKPREVLISDEGQLATLIQQLGAGN